MTLLRSARSLSLSLSRFLSPLAILAVSLTTGCGSGGSTAPPKLSGSTDVTLIMSSTANDQVTRFAVQLQTLTLTSQSGKTVTLLSSQQPSEFMHLNGGIEPLTTLNVPQDIYTSATVTLGAVFVCLAQVPDGGLEIANYSIVNQPPTVTLASTPITVTGTSMAIIAEHAGCGFGGFSRLAIATLRLKGSP
jgi:hypothetical protein